MDGGAWWAAVHWVAKSRTRLSDFTFSFHFHALEKEMATHSSVLAWRISGTEEAGGLPSMGSHSRTWLKQLSSSRHCLVTGFCCLPFKKVKFYFDNQPSYLWIIWSIFFLNVCYVGSTVVFLLGLVWLQYCTMFLLGYLLNGLCVQRILSTLPVRILTSSSSAWALGVFPLIASW